MRGKVLMKRNILRAIATVAVLAMLVTAGALVLTACKDKDTPPQENELTHLLAYQKPSGLPDYALTIEWLDQNGNATEFQPKKPVMILLNGYSYASMRETLLLDEENYVTRTDTEDGGLDYNSADINHRLEYYWINMGYNVGVFHYEAFADDLASDLTAKIVSAEHQSYIGGQGNEVTAGIPQYSLIEVFCAQWIRLMQASPITGSDNALRPMEIRLIANGAGVTLANGVTDYLYSLYEKGLIDGWWLPRRVTMIDPYFDNAEEALTVTYSGEAFGSALRFNETLVTRLAAKGVVYDMIESDADYYLAYDEPYSGVVESVVDGETVYEPGNTGDCLSYDNIRKQTAYLKFSESYSKGYTAVYAKRDRAALDWYLYSVNGSDYTSLDASSNGGYKDTLPILNDPRDNSRANVFGISAWTPTAYTRALRGMTFTMKESKYESGKGYVYYDYTMRRFRAEPYQYCVLTETVIAGYIYDSLDRSAYVNLSPAAAVAGVTVTLAVDLDNDGDGEQFLTAKTDASGWYSIALPKNYYGKTIRISTEMPSRYYDYLGSFVATLEYLSIERSRFDAQTNTVGISFTEEDSRILIYNAGLKKLQ